MAIAMLTAFAASPLVGGETPPVLRIPRMAPPPAIDGRLGEKEWDGALAITGLRCHQLDGHLAPAILQCIFYLTYDEQYLYLAMRSPLPAGRFPVGTCGFEDDENIFRDDRLEWQILKFPRNQAQRSGFGFFKLIINPLATPHDLWYWGPVEGGDELWEANATSRCHVGPGIWEAEIAMPIASLGENNPLDGRTLAMFLARGDANGNAFLCWSAKHWLDWQAAPDIIFDPAAPAVQVLDWGAPEEGRIELHLAIQAPAARDCEVDIGLRVLAAEQETAAEKRRVQIKAGERREERIALPEAKPDEKNNILALRIAEGDKVLHASETPFKPVPQAYRDGHLAAWLKSLPTTPPQPMVVAPEKPTGVLDRLAIITRKAARLMNAFSAEMRRGNLETAEKAAQRMVRDLPWLPHGYFSLSFLHGRRGQVEECLQKLEEAVARGWNEVEPLQHAKEFELARGDERFAAILEKAAKAAPLLPLRPAVPAAIEEGVAWIKEENVEFDPQRNIIVSRFHFSSPPPEKPLTSLPGAAGDLLRQWWADGTAAGHDGDLYDNRDGDHSDLDAKLFPRLARVEYSPLARQAGLHWGLPERIWHDAVVMGNASVAQTMGPYWRSMPRLATQSQAGADALYRQYRGNQLYIYPAHVDYRPGHNGKGGHHGDVFPANTPYLIASQGSSGSDKPFMQAAAAALAAFRPEVKQRLIKEGMLMPVIQMLLRSTSKLVAKAEDYLTGAAHPPVFEGGNVQIDRLVEAAHGMTLDALPPLALIKVMEEDKPENGRDFFAEAGRTEVLLNTPCAIARVFRGVQYRRRLVVSAEESFDVNSRPLTWRWVVLSGNAEDIKFTALNDQQSRVEISIPYHPRRPITPGNPLETNRVDIGVFVHNGVYWSPPAFITFFSLDHEEREYAPDGRILRVIYRGADEPGNYVDPVVALPKSWRDEYHYAPDGALLGWSRFRGDKREEFDASGRLIVKPAVNGQPAVTKAVRYVIKPGKAGQTPCIVQEDVAN